MVTGVQTCALPIFDARDHGSWGPAAWDALSAAELRRRGSMKWDVAPDVIGAWVAEMDLGTAPSVTTALERAVRDHTFAVDRKSVV